MRKDNAINLLDNTRCNLCPRECNADRDNFKLGFCENTNDFHISSICIHRGEEPPISGSKGICNVFFYHCNLQCNYCQNYQISRNDNIDFGNHWDLGTITNKIIENLNSGIESVGFVTPSHQIPQMIKIIDELRAKSYNPNFIYNTNSYDKPEIIDILEGYIDVYLPDFKYSDNSLSRELSDADNYFEIALKAIKKMLEQSGKSLLINDNGYATKGIIIRHLILPGYLENSKKILQTIAEEISSEIHLSVMSQYYPASYNNNNNIPSLNRKLLYEEYDYIQNYMEHLGLNTGWIQELESSENFLPDFCKKHPFEN